ncbi:hypothetical protein SAMN05216167_12024 [Spirosoma endophyticum]|uniref:Uncharacterized protein n=1 Tax=Spirosoma endophyticum TaxID=662367 RepID=A0A1I2DQ06_9BACT|nr:hypothetical protein SAMN05216167_12024 [Spirosoma endophyticum]
MEINSSIVNVVLMLLLNGSCTKKTANTTQAVLPVKTTSTLVAIDSIPTSLDSNCHISGPVVLHVKDKEGYVTYRGNVPLYSIVTTPPYDSDSQTIGYVCNMPDKFKRATLKVKFSGRFYHAYKFIKRKTAGETNLYLQLDSIRIAPL